MPSIASEEPAAWSLMRALWKDRLTILACAVIGAVVGGLLVLRPHGPEVTSRVTLPVVSRFIPYEGLVADFQVFWERSPMGSNQMPGAWTTLRFDNRSRSMEITVVAGDEISMAAYLKQINALTKRFAEEYAAQVNTQLQELTSVTNSFPQSGTSDYVASTAHKMRLALKDVAGGLIAVEADPPSLGDRSALTLVLTVAAGLVFGLMVGLLLAVARMSWAAGATFPPVVQTTHDSSPKLE